MWFFGVTLSVSLVYCTDFKLLFLFSEPNAESGANVDASKMWRDERELFYKRAKEIVKKSLGYGS